nr:DNA topoisomerase 2 isoform X2 [Tanacetum cinerariifolium]
MENTVEQDQEHEVYGGDIPEMDTDFEMSRDDETTVGCTPEIDCLDWFSDPEAIPLENDNNPRVLPILHYNDKHGFASMTYSKNSLFMAWIFHFKSKSFMTMSIRSQGEASIKRAMIVERNDWLQAHQAGDSKEKHIRYRDFIKKELFVFSNQISIPSVVDGLNLGQRKILFCAFKKPIIEAIQVSEFSFYVSVHSAYHHRNARLVDTILGMAHSYVGCNNINLLQLPGQFGTRLLGGKDHLSARCILTQLSPITRYIFHKADERLLNYLNDSGQSIEPAW